MEHIMKANAIVSALVAMGLSLGGPSFAQGDGDQQAREQAQRQAQRATQQQRQPARQQQAQRANQQQVQRGQQQQAQRARQQQAQRAQQQQQQRDYQQQAQRNDRRDERGAGPDHDFRRGDRLPPEYRNRSYVVDDWRAHHLSAPPRGYHWVQTGADYVLVAIATGIILQLLLNN
jgi:Ni/Co efflux regulator RcnB